MYWISKNTMVTISLNILNFISWPVNFSLRIDSERKKKFKRKFQFHLTIPSTHCDTFKLWQWMDISKKCLLIPFDIILLHIRWIYMSVCIAPHVQTTIEENWLWKFWYRKTNSIYGIEKKNYALKLEIEIMLLTGARLCNWPLGDDRSRFAGTIKPTYGNL